MSGGKKGKGLHMVTFLLLIIGGLNWLIFALSGWDLGQLFGEMNNTVAKVIYILVGLAAIVELVSHKKCCTACGGGCENCGPKDGNAGGSMPGGDNKMGQ